jgi:hypothetical protein
MRITLLLSLVLLFATFATANADSKTIRQSLVSSENTRQIYAIDEYNTLVVPQHNAITGTVSSSFIEEMQGLCSTQLDITEMETVEDLITEETTTRSKSTAFKPSALKAALDFKTIKQGVGCSGQFRVTQVYGSVLNGTYRVKSFVMKHDQPQPLVYKTEAIEGEVTLPPNGKVTFIKEKAVEDVIGKGVVAVFGGIGNLFGGKTFPFADEDLIQYLQAVCSKYNLTARFIINKGTFKESQKGNTFTSSGKRGENVDQLVEVNALEAMKYAFNTDNRSISKLWFFAAEGDKRFIVKVKHVPNVRIPESHVALNRGTEGLKFQAMEKKTPETITEK